MTQGWKTFLVAMGIAIFGALETFDFTQYLSAENAGIVTLLIAIVMMVLRAMTKTPVFKSE